MDNVFVKHKRFAIETVASLPGGLGSTQAGYIVLYNGQLYIWTGTIWATWGGLNFGSYSIMTDPVDADNDMLIIYDASSGTIQKISLNKLTVRKQTIFLDIPKAQDYVNSNENRQPTYAAENYIAPPFQHVPYAQFDNNIVAGPQYINWCFPLPNEYDGGNFTIQYGVETYPGIQPPGNVQFNFQAGIYLNNTTFNAPQGAIGSCITSITRSGAFFISPQATVIPAGAGAGQCLVHLKAWRDCNTPNNFTDYIRLVYMAVEFNSIHLSS